MSKEFELLKVRIVGFIGQHDFTNGAVIAAKIRAQLESLHSPGTQLLALSPLTGPADLLFAQQALDLGLPLVIALTLPREELRERFAGDQRGEFDRVLENASNIEPLMLAPQPDTTTRLGRKLVDEADVLLAVSHRITSSDGASAEVISYATRCGRPVIRLWDDEQGTELADAKSGVAVTERRMSIEDIQKLLGEAPPNPTIPDGLLKYFHTCDKHATNAGPSVRAYVVNIVLANSVASMASSVGSGFGRPGEWGVVLIVIKILAIVASLWMAIAMKRMEARRRWLDLRLAAEVCRSAIATWASPVTIEPISADEAPNLRSLLQALRYYRATRRSAAPISLEAFKASYGARLIEQYKYFEKQANAAILVATWMSPLALYLNWLTLSVSFFALCLQFPVFSDFSHKYHFAYFWVVMIPIVIPQIVTCLIAWQSIEAVSRKRARFVEMRDAMHQSLVDLIHCHSWPTVQSVAKRAEKMLLTEVLEWHSFFKFSG